MAKSKPATDKVATPAAEGSKTATTKVAKTTQPTAEAKPKAETKTVCFTDRETGKTFCGEMTEVAPKDSPKKVSGTRRRKR